jgi:hypothetical protein
LNGGDVKYGWADKYPRAWSNKTQSLGWISLYCPSHSLHFYPIDYWWPAWVNELATNSQTQCRSANFNLYNVRTDCDFCYFMNDTTTKLIAGRNWYCMFSLWALPTCTSTLHWRVAPLKCVCNGWLRKTLPCTCHKFVRRTLHSLYTRYNLSTTRNWWSEICVSQQVQGNIETYPIHTHCLVSQWKFLPCDSDFTTICNQRRGNSYLSIRLCTCHGLYNYKMVSTGKRIGTILD